MLPGRGRVGQTHLLEVFTNLLQLLGLIVDDRVIAVDALIDSVHHGCLHLPGQHMREPRDYPDDCIQNVYD